MVKNLPANAGDTASIPGSGRSPGGRHGSPLQYSCLENPVDRGAWWGSVSPWVAKSCTGPSKSARSHTFLCRSSRVTARRLLVEPDLDANEAIAQRPGVFLVNLPQYVYSRVSIPRVSSSSMRSSSPFRRSHLPRRHPKTSR